MNQLETSRTTSASEFVPLFDWDPDLERFERELSNATRMGQPDYLTLCEMECSLDLIEAELRTLRGCARQDGQKSKMLHEWILLRARLSRLIAAMHSLGC